MLVDGYVTERFPTRDEQWIVIVPKGTDLEILPPAISEEIGTLRLNKTFDIPEEPEPNSGIVGVKDPKVVLAEINSQGFYVRNVRAEVLLDRTREVVEELVREGRATFAIYPKSEGQVKEKVGVTVEFGGTSFFVNGEGVEGAKEELAKVIERRAREREQTENDWKKIIPPGGV